MSESRPRPSSTNPQLEMALTDYAEWLGQEASSALDSARRSELGQFFTPAVIARLMASLVQQPDEISLLDPGAGAGTLTAAVVESACAHESRPSRISATLFEVETALLPYLEMTLERCSRQCSGVGVEFSARVVNEDFVASGVEMLSPGLWSGGRLRTNLCVMNPPYHKIASRSVHRRLLRSVGIETTNLYTAFLAIAAELMAPGGQLIAITPRSFCNGPYFRSFRQRFLDVMALREIHVFDERNQAFQADDVLQENIIFRAEKGGDDGPIVLTSSRSPDDGAVVQRTVSHDSVVRREDPDQVIHLVTTETDQAVRERLAVFSDTLEDLGMQVSTGRVVDFRVRQHLRPNMEANSAPLIYPAHFQEGFVAWPRIPSRKPNAIERNQDTESLLLPRGYYVLVRRFSSKEELRRVVAAVYDPESVPSPLVGFENHLNVYHAGGRGLTRGVAMGLAAYLNSTLVDAYFRQFNGHTQVNATDLRMLVYPDRGFLERLGARVSNSLAVQEEIDRVLEEELHAMTDLPSPDPIAVRRRIDEALDILKALGLPKQQQNKRSALTLLALLGLKPEDPWSGAEASSIGITPIMDFCHDHYGTTYAPNSRETFRRFTMHQFIQAGFVIENPDEPDRPINSPKWCYQIEPTALQLMRSFGTDEWDEKLEAYLAAVETLSEQYALARTMRMIPVQLGPNQRIHLTPGNHNRLVKLILEEFAPRFVPGAEAVYVGDTGEKWAFFDDDLLCSLGAVVDAHGKMPDVVLYDRSRDWLVLVEAVTSHGPVNPKRRQELEQLFSGVSCGIVFMTAFLTRSDMAAYISDISWETEVWVADAPTHLIHFNGVRFLGPYDARE